MFRRTTLVLAAAALAATLAGAASPAAAAPGLAVTPSLNATIALNNCSASLVRYPGSVDSDRALMLTNGHCYEGGFLSAGVVLQNKKSTRSGTLLSSTGAKLGTVRADTLLYATMTGTDVSLYRLTRTYAQLSNTFGVTAMTIAATHPVNGSSMFIPSGYWKQVWTCSVNGFVPTLREGEWTWHDSIRYNTGCNTIHGTSGSPIVDTASGQVVGINNTGNDDGAMCTLNNPCEVDADGTTHAYLGQSYGQETYWFTTCLDASRQINLTVSGCLLTKP
ncbi:serine protease [Longispora sp. K20-0274]|uniref:S1 family peptidase n=1 Tax=Longispora sp. K20-0274 TaxID=3088255 RepID=UPI00399C0D0F